MSTSTGALFDGSLQEARWRLAEAQQQFKEDNPTIRLGPVGAGQPVAQMRRRLVRRLAVEGHHGGWHTRNPDDMSTPTLFVDLCHLY